LFTNLTGHLNPTIKLAKYYQNKGYRIYYCGLSDLLPFTHKHNFSFYLLNSLPFATGFDDILHDKQSEKWLESLFDRYTDKLYKLRKNDISRLVNELNPDLIFLDEFNYSDFILFYPFLEKRRLVILQTKFPMYKSEVVPPLNTFEFPNKNAKSLWKTYLKKKKWQAFTEYLKYFGKNDMNLLKQKFKEQNIPKTFQINTNKAFKPTFKNVEEWFLVPKELDFKEQLLFSWQKYIGPMVNINRKESFDSNYLNFIEKQKAAENSKLIYCSLGTVLKSHIKFRKGGIDAFFYNLINIALEQPNLYFLVALDKEMRAKFESKSKNLLFVDYAPQMDILKKADVFLTHAGPGSVFEAVFCAIPMILFPLNDKWDQNGTAARVVHHGLGKKADLGDTKIQILEAIQLISTSKTDKEKAIEMSKLFAEKYHDNFLENILLNELLVQ
jgi:UDP:flavonoid glycosyltransferase YjiC (YdhE family)